jgi:hypothetical protein
MHFNTSISSAIIHFKKQALGTKTNLLLFCNLVLLLIDRWIAKHPDY